MKATKFLTSTALIALTAAACIAQKNYELDGNRLKVEMAPVFSGDTDKINPLFDSGLKFVKDYLTDKPYITLLRIESHVNTSAKDGQELSEKRALAVAKWLVQNGVDCKRLIAVGFGSTKPLNLSGSGPGNERTEFINAALAGHPIGGMPVDGGGKNAGSLCSIK